MKSLGKKYLPLALTVVALIETSKVDAIYHNRKRSLCSSVSKCRRDLGSSMLDNVVTDVFSVPIVLNSLLKHQKPRLERELQSLPTQSTSPAYDIFENEEKVELSMDLPGVLLQDLSIELQQGGKVVKISGSRKYGHQFTGTNTPARTAKIDQMFTIDDSLIDVDNMSAHMENGVLVVSAPKIKKNIQTDRKVPINRVTKATDDEVNVDRADNVQTEPDDDDGLEISEEEDIEV